MTITVIRRDGSDYLSGTGSAPAKNAARTAAAQELLRELAAPPVP